MFYADYVILGQVIEALNSPENISNYVCKERETKLVRRKYDPSTGDFLGLYKTVGSLIVRRDEEEHLLNYGYNNNKSKLLYSFYKSRIPNSFGGTMFSRHRIMFESGELNRTFSKIYFSFPSTTDRSEEINKYMNCVNIHPLDFDEKEFGDDFNPSRLDFVGDKKEQTTQSVVNMLKRITEISNTNLIKNADGLLHSKPT